MLKFISYLNLFLGIILIAILKSNNNYLDLALILPSIFFNWVTLFHFIKNSLKFEKWHLYLGFLSIFFSAVSILITCQVLLASLSSKEITFGPPIYFVGFRIFFDVLIVLQFVMAFRANRHLQLK